MNFNSYSFWKRCFGAQNWFWSCFTGLFIWYLIKLLHDRRSNDWANSNLFSDLMPEFKQYFMSSLWRVRYLNTWMESVEEKLSSRAVKPRINFSHPSSSDSHLYVWNHPGVLNQSCSSPHELHGEPVGPLRVEHCAVIVPPSCQF